MGSLSWHRLVPSSLAGQLIGLLLIALVLAQALSLWVFHDERRIAIAQVARDNLLSRAVSIAKLVEETPEELKDRILEASSSRFAAFWIGQSPLVFENGSGRIVQRLQAYLADSFDPPRDVRIDVDSTGWHDHSKDKARNRSDTPDSADRDASSRNTGQEPMWRTIPRDERPRDLRRVLRREVNLAISIPLADGSWLNVATSYRPPPQAIVPLLVQLGLMALAVIGIVAFAARRIAKPLRELTGAAEKLGRGETIPALKVAGPREVQSVTEAFNAMQDRLTRFVNDRTRMLAAISHDLRTPITSLRIRAEFVEDDENRDKIIETLDEMAAMTEATLAFAKDEAKTEAARAIDLGGLLDSLAGDQQDMGHAVSAETDVRVVLTCRPMALKRALRNLIDNAVRYGGGAKMTLRLEDGMAVIAVRDNGPGIPGDRLKDVFEPFVRLEESRNEETGGIGLGLAICRSIIHAHGGTIALSNRHEGGLEAEIRLPLGTS